MKYLIIISLIIFLGCKKSTKKKVVNKNLKTIYSYNLNEKINIPENFYKIDIDSFSKKITNLNKGRKQELENQFEKIKTIAGTEIFVEEDNLENCFWIQKGPRIELNKKVASQYIRMLNKDFVSSQIARGYNAKKVEGVFFSTKKSQIIKAKYLIENNVEKRYQTQFLVSINKKPFTLLITVNNFKNEDMEYVVKKI